MNAVVQFTPPRTDALSPQNIGDAMKLAEVMATAKMVPSHLQGKPGDCLMVIEQAVRWGMSPFAVAQSTSVIQGKLMFEGKLVAAAVHSAGILAGRLSYEFDGHGDARMITVKGTLKGESAARHVQVFLRDAKTANQMWTKQPDQQLVYHGTRVWARRHAPEVMLGVYSPDEMDEAPGHVGPERAKDITPSTPVTDPQTGEIRPADAPKPAHGEPAARAWVEQQRSVLDSLTFLTELREWQDANGKRIEALGKYPDVVDYLNALIAETSDRVSAASNLI